MVTDARLRPVYERLARAIEGASRWGLFLQACDDAAWAAVASTEIRKKRRALRPLLTRIERLAVELAGLLDETRDLAAAAGVGVPPAPFLLLELIELAGEGSALYRVLARDGVAGLMRIRTDAVPTPAELLRVLARQVEATLEEDPVAVNAMLEAALASRKPVVLKNFARAFDHRCRETQCLQDLRLSHRELAAVGMAALALPASWAGFSEEEGTEIWRLSVRGARRRSTR